MARLEESLERRRRRYLEAVAKETLRARPVVFDVARLSEGALLDQVVRASRRRARRALDTAIHRLQGIYPEPARLPARAVPRGQAESYSWIPFGGGVRRCIGATFASFEMKVVLREVLASRVGARARPEAGAEAPQRDAGALQGRPGDRRRPREYACGCGGKKRRRLPFDRVRSSHADGADPCRLGATAGDSDARARWRRGRRRRARPPGRWAAERRRHSAAGQEELAPRHAHPHELSVPGMRAASFAPCFEGGSTRSRRSKAHSGRWGLLGGAVLGRVASTRAMGSRASGSASG